MNEHARTRVGFISWAEPPSATGDSIEPGQISHDAPRPCLNYWRAWGGTGPFYLKTRPHLNHLNTFQSKQAAVRSRFGLCERHRVQRAFITSCLDAIAAAAPAAFPPVPSQHPAQGGTCMAGRRRPVSGRLHTGKGAVGAAAEIRSPLVPPMAAMEEGAGGVGASGALASTPKAAPVDRYHLAYAIFYLQVRGIDVRSDRWCVACVEIFGS